MKNENFDEDVIKKNYIAPKPSRHYVPKITKDVTNQAMGKKVKRYIKTRNFENQQHYLNEAKRILQIAESKEPGFTIGVDAPEAHKMAIRINHYLEIEAKEKGIPFNPIEYTHVLKAFTMMRRVYRNLLLYFRGLEQGQISKKFDIDKGIYIYGGTGCGKTLAMEIFKEYTMNNLQTNSFRVVAASDILDRVYKKGINALDEFIRSPVTYEPINLYIEDFGAGSKTVKFMGNDVEPMGELIMRRYRYWEKYGTLTHVCTNIRPEDFSKHFGPRVRSRLEKMFNHINFHSFDWRKI